MRSQPASQLASHLRGADAQAVQTMTASPMVLDQHMATAAWILPAATSCFKQSSSHRRHCEQRSWLQLFVGAWAGGAKKKQARTQRTHKQISINTPKRHFARSHDAQIVGMMMKSGGGKAVVVGIAAAAAAAAAAAVPWEE